MPYNSGYGDTGLPPSAVRVGGQMYSLIFDSQNLILQQASSPDAPYVYPYNVISDFSPVENEYYEPCIEVIISYPGGETASMVMVFESPGERDAVLSQIDIHLNVPSPGGYPAGEQSPESHDSYEGYSDHASGAGDYYSPGYDSGSTYESSYNYDSYQQPERQTFDEYKYSRGNLSLVEKVAGLLRYPGETFESVVSEDFKSGAIYACLMLAVFSVANVFISAVIASAAAPDNPVYGVLLGSIPELVRLILEYFIFGAVCIIVYGLLVFLLTKVTGQGLDLTESMQTTFYSATPLGTAGIIPLAGIFIAPLWMVFLQFKGLYEGLDADLIWAAVSAVVPAFVMFLLFYYFVISGEVMFI